MPTGLPPSSAPSAAPSPPPLLCAASTAADASSTCILDALGRRRIKGRDGPLHAAARLAVQRNASDQQSDAGLAAN